MPRAVKERTCNLTFSRSEWALVIGMLDDAPGEESRKVRMAIRTALQADSSSEVSIERDCEKWTSVLQLVNRVPKSFKREYNEVVKSMTCQVSRAEFGGGSSTDGHLQHAAGA